MSNRVFLMTLGMMSASSLIGAAPAFAQRAASDQAAPAGQTDAGQSAAAGAPARPAARAEEGGGLTEIIVTARRLEERVQDVPISITVFNQQQLSNRNVVNSSDLATYTPSLQANTNFGSSNSAFAIRGFVQDIGTQPSVGVYFADVVAPRGASSNLPIGDGAGPGTFFDLQNVQVLKGPQGTLFGRNTTGGAILVVPQKPTSTEEGYVEASYGNYDMKRIQAVENIPVSDNVRFRIGIDHQNREGYLINDVTTVGPSRLGDVEYTAARASLVVDITPDLENYSILSFVDSDPNGDVQKVIGCNATPSLSNFLGPLACQQLAQEQAKGAGFYTVQSGLSDPFTRLTQWQFINTTTWHSSDTLTIKNVASYAQLDEKFRSALFGTNFLLAPGVAIDFANSTPLPGGSTADESTATEELQFQGRTDNDLFNWQAGAYIENVEPLAVSGSQSPVLLDCVNSDNFNCLNPIGVGSVNSTAGKSYFNNVGLYEQATYSLTDKLKLTEGLRNTWDKESNNSQLITYQVPTPGTGVPFCTNPDLVPPECKVHYQESSHAPTWLLDLDYKPTDDILVYGKYARGYRAGGIVPSAPTEFSTFKPEKVDTYETGFKTTFHGSVAGTFDVAAFYNNFSDQQLQLNFDPKPLAPVSPASGILNAGKSRIYGLEVDASVIAFGNFTLEGGYTYLNTRIQQVTLVQTPASSPYVIGSPIAVGDELTLSPKNKVTLTGTYTVPLGQNIGRVSGSATFVHTGSMIANYVDAQATNPAIAALSTLPALNLLNLNLNWNAVAGSPVDLAFFATNVTNKQYYTYVPGLYGSTNFETAQLGQPRMYGIRARYSW